MKIIPADRIDLQYRDDIALRIYCLMHNDFGPYKKYTENNHHVKKGKEGEEIEKIRSCYKYMKKGKNIPPIKILLKDGRMYPLDGAKRLSCSYVLKSSVPIIIRPVTEEYRLSKPFNVDCDKFADVPAHIKKVLRLRKVIINKATDNMTEKRFDKLGLCYYSVPDLGIIGGRDCAKRSKLFGLNSILPGKKVLDIGSNMGMLSLECSKQAAEVDGVEPNKGYYEIAKLLKEFFSSNNVNFYNTTFLDFISASSKKYDVILSLVANWIGQKERVFLKTVFDMLENNGVMLYESHRNFKREKFIINAKQAGFTIEREGDVDRRKFLICRKR